MANKLLVIGPSGTGKTYSLRNLKPEQTFIICADEKELPFKGWMQNYKTVRNAEGKVDRTKSNFLKIASPSTILNAMKYINDSRPDIKVVVIDTLTMMMVKDYMSRVSDNGFQKFTDIATNTYNILQQIDNMREDLFVIIMAHQEVAYDAAGGKTTRFKVPAGKLVGEKLEVEAMFTTVLFSKCVSNDGKNTYLFETQNDGANTCKSPADMFPDKNIPNDLKYVLQCVSAYNNGKEIPQLPTN